MAKKRVNLRCSIVIIGFGGSRRVGRHASRKKSKPVPDAGDKLPANIKTPSWTKRYRALGICGSGREGGRGGLAEIDPFLLVPAPDLLARELVFVEGAPDDHRIDTERFERLQCEQVAVA